MGLLSMVVYFGFGWSRSLAELTLGAALLVAGFYLFLVRLAPKLPDLDQSGEVIDLRNSTSWKDCSHRLHYLLPIMVLLCAC